MIRSKSQLIAATVMALTGALTVGSAYARSQVVGSFESAMKESQFQGPTSRVYGPGSNGQYLVTNGHGYRWHRRHGHRRYR